MSRVHFNSGSVSENAKTIFSDFPVIRMCLTRKLREQANHRF